MMNLNKTALVAGTLALDIIPIFDNTTSTGERMTAGGTVYLKKIDTVLGGSAGNTGLALFKLGADVTILSRVGADELSAIVESALRRTGCKYMVDTVNGMNSSASVIVSQPGQDRTIFHCRGASQKYAFDDIPEALLMENSLFHFGYPTGMECMYSDEGDNLSKMYKRAKTFGITTSMDLSFPGVNTPSGLADWRTILKKTMPYVDIFLPSYEELFLMLHRDEYLKLQSENDGMSLDLIFSFNTLESMGKEMIAYGAKIVVIKCGEIGSFLISAESIDGEKSGRAFSHQAVEEWKNVELFTSPYVANTIISTNGAGDTFVGGFLNAVMLEMSPKDAMNFASAAAMTRISSPLGREGIPKAEVLLNVLKCGQAKKKTHISPAGWIYDEKLMIYQKGNN